MPSLCRRTDFSTDALFGSKASPSKKKRWREELSGGGNRERSMAIVMKGGAEWELDWLNEMEAKESYQGGGEEERGRGWCMRI